MFVLQNFIVALAKVIDLILVVYMWLIIARAVLSWVNADPYNKIVIFIYRVTEPILRPVRLLLPGQNLGIDFSPVIVLLAIFFLRHFLVETIIQLAGYL